jgi:hypothetical protein
VGSTLIRIFKHALGTQIRFLFLGLVFFSFPALSQTQEASCLQQIYELIPGSAQETVATNHPKRQAALKFLNQHRSAIARRALDICSPKMDCSLQEMAQAVKLSIQEQLREFKVPKSSWRGHLFFGGFFSLYVTANLWISTQTSGLAMVATSVLTALGGTVVYGLGANKLEIWVPKMRLFSFRTDRTEPTPPRSAHLDGHLNVFMGSQQLLTSSEQEGRTTFRQANMQSNIAELACVPQPGESKHHFLVRSAYVFAKTLADLAPGYPELDLEERDHADWAQVLFSAWHLDETTRPLFVESVLRIIEEKHNPELKTDIKLRDSYRHILMSWTRPLEPLTLPLDTHQSQTELP